MKIIQESTSINRLTVVTGPSGVGKGTLVNELLKRHPDVWLSVSATTRKPRKGEVEGNDYFFLDRKSFLDLIDKGGLLEWAEFAGNFYGTPSKPVMNQIKIGRPVLLEIELEGARQVRRNFPEGLQIFIDPPSFEELEKRIRGRASDDEKAIEIRLSRALEELKAKNEFDAVLVNDDLFNCVKNIESFMGLN